jgi:hypothetical protein
MREDAQPLASFISPPPPHTCTFNCLPLFRKDPILEPCIPGTHCRISVRLGSRNMRNYWSLNCKISPPPPLCNGPARTQYPGTESQRVTSDCGQGLISFPTDCGQGLISFPTDGDTRVPLCWAEWSGVQDVGVMKDARSRMPLTTHLTSPNLPFSIVFSWGMEMRGSAQCRTLLLAGASYPRHLLTRLCDQCRTLHQAGSPEKHPRGGREGWSCLSRRTGRHPYTLVRTTPLHIDISETLWLIASS